MSAAQASSRGTGSNWEERLSFARAAAAHAIQHLGNEAKIPSVEDVRAAEQKFLPVNVA